MRRIQAVWVTCLLASILISSAQAADGTSDRSSLCLSRASADAGVLRISVEVHNYEALAAMDIPLRFGLPTDPITLDSVVWSTRVDGWFLKNASIDNVNKTVILGLIAEIGGQGSDQPLAVHVEGDPKIATLYFSASGAHLPDIQTFTTENPYHALTFVYNKYDRHGRPHAVEFTPAFLVDLELDE